MLPFSALNPVFAPALRRASPSPRRMSELKIIETSGAAATKTTTVVLRPAKNGCILLILLVGAGRFERPTPCAQGGKLVKKRNSLFCDTYKSRRWHAVVGLCCALLSLEEIGSYKIDYN
jgi:hypothetical protein